MRGDMTKLSSLHYIGAGGVSPVRGTEAAPMPAAAQGARSLATTGSQRIVTPSRTPTGVSPVSSTIRGLP